MAFNILNIGADLGIGLRELPIALGGFQKLKGGLPFPELLRQGLDDLTQDDPALAQIAALLQSGTPISTIAERVAQNLTTALAQTSAVAPTQNARSTLQRALASALAPPGTSPPANAQQAYQLAATLETRLGNLLTTLSSATTAGQKNEISGKLLDAATAKESPAQQQSTTVSAGTPVQNAAFTRALLTQAAAPSTTAAPELAQSDVLTRILARAGAAPQSSTPAAPAAHAAAAQNAQPAGTGSTSANAGSNASNAFDKLTAVIAQHYASGDNNPSSQQQQQQQTPLLPQPQLGTQSPQSALQNAAVPAFVNHLPGSTGTIASSAQPAQPYAPVDPQAVIDQVVKGIVVNTAGSDSQIRLQLSPQHLGDVAMRLTVSGNNVSATMVAQNAGVRDALLANQQQLARALSESGLSLSNFSVDVSGGNNGSAQQQPRGTAIHRRIGGKIDTSNDLETSDTQFGPPLLGGGRSLVLNYLA